MYFFLYTTYPIPRIFQCSQEKNKKIKETTHEKENLILYNMTCILQIYIQYKYYRHTTILEFIKKIKNKNGKKAKKKEKSDVD